MGGLTAPVSTVDNRGTVGAACPRAEIGARRTR